VRVAIDAHLLSDQQSYRSAGVSNYSAELLRALGVLASEERVQPGSALAELTAYLHAASFTTPGIGSCARACRWKVRWRASPGSRASSRCTCGASAPAGARAGERAAAAAPCPGVVTVHDLAFVRAPETMRPVKRIYLTDALSRQCAPRRARDRGQPQTAIGCTALLWNAALRGSPLCTTAWPRVSRRAAPMSWQAFRQQRGLPPRYLLYLGTLEPRKNLEQLVRAFARWRAATAKSQRTM
jgi:glycosyltransferase involved in cell wall biosynthesis